MKETLKNLYTVLMCILTGLAVLSFIGMTKGIRTRILITSSMQPAVYEGSLVLLNIETPWEGLEEGDIVAFRSGKTKIMHRVSKVAGNGLILKPDNGNGESFITKDMYVGKEVIAFPYIGGMIRPVLLHGNRVVVIVAIAMVIVGCWGMRRKNGEL